MNIIRGKLLEQQLGLGPVRGFVCWVAAVLEPAGRGRAGRDVLASSPSAKAGSMFSWDHIATQVVPALVPVKWSGTMGVPCSCHSLYLVLSMKLDI